MVLAQFFLGDSFSSLDTFEIRVYWKECLPSRQRVWLSVYTERLGYCDVAKESNFWHVLELRGYATELEDAPYVALGRQFSLTPVTEADLLWAVTRSTSNAGGADNILIRFNKDTIPIT